MTADELRKRVWTACEAAGSRRAFAKAHGISPVYLGEILNGTREPGPLLLRVMGYRKRVVYEPVPGGRS